MLRAERIQPLPDRPATRAQTQAQTPLSHHEILRLVGPFTRSGRSVDLAASDRLARRLDFKPQPHGDSGMQEQLRLEDIGRDGFALTRIVMRDDGRHATLLAEGEDIETLLRWVDAVPAAVHWRGGKDWTLALHHRLTAPGRGAEAGAVPLLILTHAQAWLPRLDLAAKVSRVKNVPAEITLQATAGSALALPEDLLSVLGLDWSRLARIGSTWRVSLRLKGEGAARSRDAETKLAHSVAHLAQTLAEPPVRFHERFAAARWRVSLRRAVPLLVCLGLIAAAIAVPWMGITRDSVLQMLIMNAPPILLVWLFTMRELPRIEIPPLPRPPNEKDW
jgi:hypothetical protein